MGMGCQLFLSFCRWTRGPDDAGQPWPDQPTPAIAMEGATSGDAMRRAAISRMRASVDREAWGSECGAWSQRLPTCSTRAGPNLVLNRRWMKINLKRMEEGWLRTLNVTRRQGCRGSGQQSRPIVEHSLLLGHDVAGRYTFGTYSRR